MPSNATSLHQAVEDLALARSRLEAAVVLVSAALCAFALSEQAKAQAKEAKKARPPRSFKTGRQGQ